MRIDIKDPRVNQAIEYVKNKHNLPEGKEFYQVFEEQYHCKMVADPKDMLCLNGWMVISEDKYSNWFVLQFGNGEEITLRQ